jgi:hypothetical protein
MPVTEHGRDHSLPRGGGAAGGTDPGRRARRARAAR